MKLYTADGHLALTDKRTKIGKTIAYYVDWYQDNRSSFWSAILLGLLAGTIASVSFWRAKHDPNPFSDRESPVKTTIELAVVSTATPTPTPSWNNAIRDIFPKDEAGRMIRICLAENRSSSKYATNYNTNGSYDYSYCQINSVHRPKYMDDYEWKAYLEDPVNHAKEVRRIFLSQGWGAWTVARWTE